MNKRPTIFQTCKRLLSYIILKQKLLFSIVVVCVLISSCTVVASSLFLETLIDDYITPLLVEDNPVFTGFFHSLIFFG